MRNMDLSFWAATNIGRKRTHNEDNFLVDQKLSLFVVADGMGGHASGEVASQIAVTELRTAVDSRRDIIDAYARHDTGVTTHDVLGVLEYAVQTAGLAWRVSHAPACDPAGNRTRACAVRGRRPNR